MHLRAFPYDSGSKAGAPSDQTDCPRSDLPRAGMRRGDYRAVRPLVVVCEYSNALAAPRMSSELWVRRDKICASI